MKTVDRFIEIAKAEVGVVEEKYNKVKYNEWYYGRKVSASSDESGSYAWCAVFISWCAYMAGIPEGVIPKFALCNDGRTFYKAVDRYDTDISTVKKGDIVFINWSGGTKLQHVGIVVEVNDSTITTVEGNRSNAVRLETYNIGDKRLIGFAHPDFDSLDPKDEPSEDTETVVLKKSVLEKIIEYIINILKILIGKDIDE